MSDAEDRLAVAIREVLDERGLIGEGRQVGDFVVMAELPAWTESQLGTTAYANIIPGEYGIPAHRLLGLIQVCSALIREDDDASS